MCFWKCKYKEPDNRDLLYQILLELVKIELAIQKQDQLPAVALNLKAGTPEPNTIIGFKP